MRLPKANPRPAPTTLTVPQVRELAEACSTAGRQPLYGELVTFLAWTGLRYGEAIALRVSDLDLPRSRVHVTRSYVEVEGTMIDQATTKSSHARHAPLTDELVQMLAKRCDNRPPTALVFGTASGKPLRNGTFRRATGWIRLREQLGHPALRIHDLRAVAITRWIEAGIPTTDAMKFAGHSSLNVTTFYARIRNDALNQATDALNALRSSENHPTTNHTNPPHNPTENTPHTDKTTGQKP